MNKETWKHHIEQDNVVRPSHGGNKLEWQKVLQAHADNRCKLCLQRKKTQLANLHQKYRNNALRDLCGTSAAAAKRDMGY